ncbi:MAG: pinensin family lanthipeptide [Cyclobacteriaceae bacterium]
MYNKTKLSDLKVKSFVTESHTSSLRGGIRETDFNSYNGGCASWEGKYCSYNGQCG